MKVAFIVRTPKTPEQEAFIKTLVNIEETIGEIDELLFCGYTTFSRQVETYALENKLAPRRYFIPDYKELAPAFALARAVSEKQMIMEADVVVILKYLVVTGKALFFPEEYCKSIKKPVIILE